MKTPLRGLLILFFLSTFLTSFGQQATWPKTLLWKIERSDLKKPSYLFGTMHLQDKRVFNLGDSFYYHFERAEGFAIEVDFKEYMDSLMGRMFNTIENDEMNETDESVAITSDSVEVVVDSSAVGEKITRSTTPRDNKQMRKYFNKLRNERIKRLLVYGEMPTILDAYIYGMAMKQGKWLGAVEEVKDQLSIKDELGKDLDDDDINQTNEKMMVTLENMIKIYLDQDLTKLEDYALNKGSTRRKTIVFNNRNVKMVTSIDSLSHLRSMFYAVGAAHLPGDSGIIKLLRSRGYKVSPVFSTSTMAAEKYAKNLPSLSWYQVGQTDSLYTVDMPGIPTEYNMFGDLLKMKVMVDLTTMTFYLAGHTIAQFEEDKLGEMLKSMASSMSRGQGRLENTRKIEHSGLKGVEGTINNDGTYFKIRILTNNNAIFFLMAGSDKKITITSPETEKFLHSFKSAVHQQTAKPKNWLELSNAEKGFALLLPGTPKRNKLYEKKAEKSDWNFTVYDLTDLSSGLYYLVQVRDIVAGSYLESDSLFFASFLSNIKDEDVKTEVETYSQFNGFSMMRYDATTEKDGLFYKTKNIIRGNRVYTLMVLGSITKKDGKETEQFFNSFRLLPYLPVETKTYTADNNTFSSKTPAQFVFMKPDEDDFDANNTNRKHYTSYNSNEAVSYEVVKDVLPKYFWSASDSSFFKNKAESYIANGDSVLSYTTISNGKINGIDQVVQRQGSSNLRKIRMLLHADTLYTLISYLPSVYMNNAVHQDFFTQFRISNDKTGSSIYQSKATKLLAALQQKDSATFHEAKDYLGDAPFTKKDLPLLHNAMLTNYPDDTLIYGSVTNKLISLLDDLSDSSTVDFIKNNYNSIDAAQEDNKAAMLNVLANYPTVYSYNLLKDLWINQTPVKLVHRKNIGYSVNDSLELTQTLYPELLQLLKHPDYWQDITDYTVELLDSIMLQPSILKPYEKQLEYLADTLLNGTLINEEDAWLWSYQNMVKLLGYINTTNGNELLQKYAAGKDPYLKQAAIISLLRNNQTVAAAEIEKLAADKEMRIGFYEELKEIKKEQYFTPKYQTQKYFAEAYLYSYGDEDYTPSSMEFIGEREVIFAGEKKRIFLFKLIYSDEEDPKNKETHLGIVGPFSLDAKDLECSDDATDIFFDEEYDKKNLEKQFKELLEKGEEYLKKKVKE